MSSSLARRVLVAALLLAGGLGAAGAGPFELRDTRGRPLRGRDLLVDPAGEHELRPMPQAGLLSLVPMAPRGSRRRGLFAELFGIPPTPPPLVTKYPVVLVHGANTPLKTKLGPITLRYFSKTEAHLRRLNLRLLVPEVNPFGSIEERAGQLEAQIQAAIPKGKFNILAHSMGGLDARFLAAHRPIGSRIASITTVATPHHGAWYADFAEKWVFRYQGLNKLGELLGMHFDQIPDLTVRHMEGEFNPKTPDNPEVAYFSYGTSTSILRSPPIYWGMNFITKVLEKRAAEQAVARGVPRGVVPLGVRHARGEVRIGAEAAATVAEVPGRSHGWIDPRWAGRNDGVVSQSSAVWGEYLGTVRTHHWGPMGWLSSLKEYKLWEEITRRLAARGF